MSVILRFITSHLLVLALLLFVGFQAHAEECSTPEFGVQNISIDQLANTAGEARELGTRAAAETAFAILLERLLNDPEKISQFQERYDLDQFSDFVHITEENNLQGRYIALLDFVLMLTACGQPSARMVLNGPSSALLSLLFPFGRGRTALAPGSENSWLSGWREAVETSNGLVNFVLLEPTIINERSLRPKILLRPIP